MLFEHIDDSYAQFLHSQSMHPYSQYLLQEDKKAVWVIQTLNKKAYQEVILPLLDADFQTIHFLKSDEEFPILSKNVETLAKRELLEEFYEEESADYFQTEFLSAASFKKIWIYKLRKETKMRHCYC